MCHLNIIFKHKSKDNSNLVLTPFLMATTSNSFASNSDGDGVYISNSDKVIKSLSKINLYDFQNDIEKSDTIISHQRLSTSGHTIEFCHPFFNDDFVLVHNGVINQFLGKVGSDTYGFFLKFNESFNNKLKHNNNREKCITETLKELFKKDEGFYSILILDKKTNKSYYFKNSSPNIHFYRIENIIYITTAYDNYKFVSMISDEDYKEIEIKDNQIYRIEDTKEKINVIDLGQLRYEQPVKKFKSLYGYGKHPKSEYDNGYKTYSEKCSNCKGQTDGTTYFTGGKAYCDDCWTFIKNYN